MRIEEGCSVPHPCDFFLSQGWETADLHEHFSIRVFSQHSSCFRNLLAATLLSLTILHAQSPPESPVDNSPIAIVPLDTEHPDSAAKVTGALEVSQGKAIIVASGTITSGSSTTQVTLPRRGTLRVCASTTVKLASDNSVPAGEVPGLLMALDHGAVEASFATGRNADILLTPDFRILIGGPGAVDVKVRLGEHGDTCVDNAGADAPYVLVTSVFGDGAYRVQPGQRVMFQRGDLHEVVDQEKEPCGCPPPSDVTAANPFPLAQSEGLAPLPAPSPASPSSTQALPTEPLTYSSPAPTSPPTPEAQPCAPAAPSAPPNSPPANPEPPKKKPGFFTRVGNFFRRLFGAEG
jgi:hypothetical protein